MGAGLKEEQRQLVVVLFPRHQPVRLYVAFPLSLVVTPQRVRPVLGRQRACG